MASPAGKEGKCLHVLRLASGIGAVQCLRLVLHGDPGRAAADGTDCRDILYTAPGQILCDLRDDHIRLIDLDPVSHSQSPALP